MLYIIEIENSHCPEFRSILAHLTLLVTTDILMNQQQSQYFRYVVTVTIISRCRGLLLYSTNKRG